MGELGKTVEGRAIPLLIVADPPVASRRRGGGVGQAGGLAGRQHPRGRGLRQGGAADAAPRAVARPGHPLLKDLVLGVVPIYNADGNERVSKDNRPGQVGPEEGMGQRANARGLDLNRDFMKLEAPETRALVRFLNEWNPALFIDTHTTNGSFHRYTVTYDGPKNPAGDRRLIDFARGSMLPEVGRRFEAGTDRHAFFYGNFAADHSEWTTFPALPRFGTTYVGLRNRLSVLSEAYAYAPYETRVLATRDFVRGCLEYAAAHRNEIQRLLARTRDDAVGAGRAPRAGDRVAIRSQAGRSPSRRPSSVSSRRRGTASGSRRASRRTTRSSSSRSSAGGDGAAAVRVPGPAGAPGGASRRSSGMGSTVRSCARTSSSTSRSTGSNR